MAKRSDKTTHGYMLANGDEATKEQIKQAYKDGRAVLRHHYGDGGTSTGLMLDGEHYDTRGQNVSMWNDTWTRTPKNLKECLEAAESSIHTYPGYF